MSNDLVMFLLWVWGIVMGWLCSNWFADYRCEKRWEAHRLSKDEDDLLPLIWNYNTARRVVAITGGKIVIKICDAIRDIIPDIEGWVGDIDSSDVLFFRSEEAAKGFDEVLLSGQEYEDWKSLDSLIGEVFPELQYKVDDNCIYLSPNKQKLIVERLKKLSHLDLIEQLEKTDGLKDSNEYKKS